MGFQLSSKPTFFFRVDVKRPGANGVWETVSFLAEFKRRPPERYREMMKNSLGSDADVLATELVGWKDVKAADGSELKASESIRAWMLEHPDEPLKEMDEARTALLRENYVEPAIALAWVEACVTGPRKN